MSDHETSGEHICEVCGVYMATNLVDDSFTCIKCFNAGRRKGDVAADQKLVRQFRDQLEQVIQTERVNLEADNARLRAELATMHKIQIAALTILIESAGEADIQEAISILETAPEPSDETIAFIEANEDEQQ